ncbi:unnamed protein product [Durusdinium trenchii]|uniref:Uncharacterized protein n=1 Tax=Durusdinium trenchii TaxID=1381693 RepID=A0ABP0K4Y4_9DINO
MIAKSIVAKGFDPSETLTTRGCHIGFGTLRFGDGQKRGLACRLVSLGCCIVHCMAGRGLSTLRFDAVSDNF